MSQPYIAITATEAKAKLDGGWKPYVLDVRAPHESAVASLPFTDRLEPHLTVSRIAKELPKDRDILVYCRMGGRSAMAAAALASAGHTRLFNLEGGITGWSRHVDPSIPTY